MIFAKERYTYRPDLFLVYNNRRRLVKRIATYGKKSGTNGKLHRLFRGGIWKERNGRFPALSAKTPRSRRSRVESQRGIFTEPLFLIRKRVLFPGFCDIMRKNKAARCFARLS